jgi:hypothetical protein
MLRIPTVIYDKYVAHLNKKKVLRPDLKTTTIYTIAHPSGR